MLCRHIVLRNEIRKNGGDSLDLSEMFTVRQCYRDKAERYVRMYGQTNFGAGGSIMVLMHGYATWCRTDDVYTRPSITCDSRQRCASGLLGKVYDSRRGRTRLSPRETILLCV